MESYLVCYTHLGYNPELSQARRLNEEEKTHYAPWFRDIGFVAIGEKEKLMHLGYLEVRDYLKREKSDGEFVGIEGEVYIISQDEWDGLLKLERVKKELADKAKIDEKITELREIIRQCEAAEKLYTKEEAVKKRKQYNNLYNEGGAGYVPHFWTIEEYEEAKSELRKLL